MDNRTIEQVRANEDRLIEEKIMIENRIKKAVEFINKNGEKQYNFSDNYRGKWYAPEELDTLLEILKGSEESDR